MRYLATWAPYPSFLFYLPSYQPERPGSNLVFSVSTDFYTKTWKHEFAVGPCPTSSHLCLWPPAWKLSLSAPHKEPLLGHHLGFRCIYHLPFREHPLRKMSRKTLEAGWRPIEQGIPGPQGPKVWPIRGGMSSRYGARMGPFEAGPTIHTGVVLTLFSWMCF